MDFSVGIEQHYGQESQYFTTNTVTSSRDVRQDLVDKVMSVDGILHVFDMSKLAINITKGEKLRILNLQRRVLHVLYVMFILCYCTQRK